MQQARFFLGLPCADARACLSITREDVLETFDESVDDESNGRADQSGSDKDNHIGP
jgi:hypothetical protein